MRCTEAAGARAAILRLSLSSFMGLVLVAACAAPCAAREKSEPVARARYLMGSICQGYIPAGAAPDTAAAGEALAAAFDEIARLEAVLSDYRADSELSRLNAAGPGAPVACSTDLFDFLARSRELSEATSGAFDITVAPLIALWDLRGAGREATDDQVHAALERVGWRRLKLDSGRRTARLERPGMSLDPGAVGKGYALDAAVRVLRSRRVSAALLDFGGQIMAIGAPRGQGGWEVDIAHPLRRGEAALSVCVRDACISTSGNDQKGIVVNGRLLGHVLDPRSGRPITSSGSATVITPDATSADALSTALLVLGQREGLRLAGREQVHAVFLDVDGPGELRVLATPGFPSINAAAGACLLPPDSMGDRP